MAYVTKTQQEAAAETIAELVALASFRDIGTSAQCARSLCATLGIDTRMVLKHIPGELAIDIDFKL